MRRLLGPLWSLLTGRPARTVENVLPELVEGYYAGTVVLPDPSPTQVVTFKRCGRCCLVVVDGEPHECPTEAWL